MNRTRTISGRLGIPTLSVVLLALTACDGLGVTVPRTEPLVDLPSGIYDYRAWSDHSDGGAVWDGVLELRVRLGGEIDGRYRLPRQCRDDFGYWIDCFGTIHGRLHRDGTVRFGFDEGWLANEGTVRSGPRATGFWEAQFIGYADRGTFELVFRRR